MTEPELELQEAHTIPLHLPDGSVQSATIEVWDGTTANPHAVRLVLRWDEQVITADHANAYWFALIAVREQLEARGILLGSYGGSRNGHPSGMSVDMGGGYLAFKMTLGKHVILKRDSVGIFATGDDVEPATIAEQWEFYELWGSGPKEW